MLKFSIFHYNELNSEIDLVNLLITASSSEYEMLKESLDTLDNDQKMYFIDEYKELARLSIHLAKLKTIRKNLIHLKSVMKAHEKDSNVLEELIDIY